MSRLIKTDSTNNRPLDRVAYALATGLGAGFTPVAPGTVGSLEGLALFLGIAALELRHAAAALLLTILNLVVFAVGVWASNRACQITGLQDARIIVIDEVSGQLITLMPLALWSPLSITGVIVGFVLFRLFDIFKPYPIRKLEDLHGGLGVMADDALAGIYSAALLWMGHLLRLI